MIITGLVSLLAGAVMLVIGSIKTSIRPLVAAGVLAVLGVAFILIGTAVAWAKVKQERAKQAAGTPPVPAAVPGLVAAPQPAYVVYVPAGPPPPTPGTV